MSAVRVCPTKDIVCGDWPGLWCLECPKHSQGPDCRTCTAFGRISVQCYSNDPCTNADRYEPLPPVRLWRTTNV